MFFGKYNKQDDEEALCQTDDESESQIPNNVVDEVHVNGKRIFEHVS